MVRIDLFLGLLSSPAAGEDFGCYWFDMSMWNQKHYLISSGTGILEVAQDGQGLTSA